MYRFNKITTIVVIIFIIFSSSNENNVLVNAQTNSIILQRIYKNVDRAMSCTRLLNADGQFGCTSKEKGNNGLLYLIDSDQSLSDLPSKAIAILDANYFNGTIINRILGKVEGIIVLTDTNQNYSYSPDIPIPNEKYSYYKNPKFNFNTHSDSLSYQSFNKPIFILTADNSVTARGYAQWNRDDNQPQYGAHLESFMHAAGDAETCLRRGFCVPIGGKSTWASFTPQIDPAGDVIMVVIPLDATAFFHDLSYGSQSTAYGQAVMLSIIEALARVDRTNWNSQVIFAAFDGERWGYLGSTKFVDDVANGKCLEYSKDGYSCNNPYYQDVSFLNITFSKIKYIVELNQIGNPLTLNANKQYLFALNSLASNADNSAQKVMYNTFNSVATALSNLSVSTQPVDQTAVPEIPPSSSMAFLKQNPNIPTIIVTDHFGAYTNKYYASHNDNYTNINPYISVDTVTLLATAIDRLAGGNNTIVPNPNFVNEVLYCLTQNFTCTLAQQFAGSSQTSPSFYTSVYGIAPDNQYLTIQSLFVHTMMAFFASNEKSVNQLCDDTVSCPNANQSCIAGACVVTNTHYHDAFSLGFTFDQKTYSWKISNTSYPTFVESNWDTISINFYQQDSHTTEALFLVFGILEMFIVIAIIYVSKKYLSKRYKLL